ncbi:MAG TPA: c-type cytochrome [Candidatus Krumholzibacteria bacterium]|nr:c-type cytochrome [Candidatus Krumholzibacteria bacterium]
MLKRIRTLCVLAGAATLLLAAGCGGNGGEGGTKISAADRKEAHDIFQTRCATCHGQFGRGDGPGAAALNPKPQNYADTAWQAKVTDAEIEKAIVYGGTAVGRSAQMVPNPDLADKPGVVAALREMVRSFGRL